MKQYQFARKKRQLKSLVEKLQYLLIYHKEEASIQIEKLIQRIKKLVQELVNVISHNDLNKILGAVAIFVGISFSNQTSAQSFALPQMNPFGLVSVPQWAAPAFADLDGDGDIDLLVGEYYGSMQYFGNTGSALNPQFSAPQYTPFGLDSTNYIALPAFADLDWDGDLDVLVGEEYGSMQYFENIGSETEPQFAAPLNNPFGLVSTFNFAAPVFADLDDDGDFDLLVGEYYGALQYFENVGTPFNPEFSAPQINPFGMESGYVNAFPAFADLDTDGDLDLLLGNYYGEMKYFENTGTSTNPQFASPLVNPFGLISTYYAAFPAFADLDDDGDLDLLVGEIYGSMEYFENTTLSGVSGLSQDIDIRLFPNPVMDIIKIESKERVEKIEVFNLLGKSVVEIRGSTNQVSLAHLNSGIYSLKLTFKDGSCTIRKIQKF